MPPPNRQHGLVLGKKKGPTVAEAGAVADWQVSQGTYEGDALVVRFNRAFQTARDRSDYPIQIGVALPLTDPDERGLPRKAETPSLDQAEETIIDQAGDYAFLVGVISTKGMREFVLYADRPEWVESFDRALQAAVTDHKVQIMAKRDPQWSTYSQFVK